MILGLTGNIASGKSTVANYFAAEGADLVSADQLAREVVRPGSPVLERVVERFGDQVLAADGSLDRGRLAERIFADPAAREDLNALLHPAIAALAERELDRRNAAGRLVVYESPLLYEAGAEGRVDRVLVVTVDPQVQLQRLTRRDDLDEAAARRRMEAQMPQEEKVRRADFVIDNSGSRAACRRQVRELMKTLDVLIRDRSESR